MTNTHTNSNTDPMNQLVKVMLLSQVPQEFVLLDKLYQCIPQDARAVFNKARAQLYQENQSKPAATATSTTTGTALPKQYETHVKLADHGLMAAALEGEQADDEHSVSTNNSTLYITHRLTVLVLLCMAPIYSIPHTWFIVAHRLNPSLQVA